MCIVIVLTIAINIAITSRIAIIVYNISAYCSTYFHTVDFLIRIAMNWRVALSIAIIWNISIKIAIIWNISINTAIICIIAIIIVISKQISIRKWYFLNAINFNSNLFPKTPE